MKNWLDIPEEIKKMEVVEIIDEKGWEFSYIIINDKYKVTATGNEKKPFKVKTYGLHKRCG